MGNACDCASVVFGGESGPAGKAGSFGSGVGSGINGRGAAPDVGAIEARRAFEAYSDSSPNHQQGAGDARVRKCGAEEQIDRGAKLPSGGGPLSNDLDSNFGSRAGGLVDEHSIPIADDFSSSRGGAHAHEKEVPGGKGDEAYAESAASSQASSFSKDLVPSTYGPALLSGDQEDKMWEDLSYDLRVLDDELARDTSEDTLSLESLTTQLRGFSITENGSPTFASGAGRAGATTGSKKTAGVISDVDLLSSKSSVKTVVAQAEDVLAGLAEFAEDDYDEEDGLLET